MTEKKNCVIDRDASSRWSFSVVIYCSATCKRMNRCLDPLNSVRDAWLFIEDPHPVYKLPFARGKEKTNTKKSMTLSFCYRSIYFLACFLHEFGQGDKSVEDAMNKAYGQTLKRYHGWITRGLFSVIIIFIHKTKLRNDFRLHFDHFLITKIFLSHLQSIRMMLKKFFSNDK
jgi:hypothetical protein